MEIGSEFWLEDNQVTSDLHSSIAGVQWLDRFGTIQLTSSGRSAIALILSLVKPRNRKVLLPSYICHSVIMPFQAAGYELLFYDLDQDLCPIDIDCHHIDAGIFYYMGYFGSLPSEKLKDIIIRLKASSVIIVEDVTHSLFSWNENEMPNDFVIGSIRKWFGLPLGGFAAIQGLNDITLIDPPEELIALRTAALHKKHEYLATSEPSLKAEYLDQFKKAEEMIEWQLTPYKIDSVSENIIRNTDVDTLRSFRMRNYQYLWESLQGIANIEPVFKELQTNITPLFFPLLVKTQRGELKAELAKKGIFCPVHWPIPNQVKNNLSYPVKRFYDLELSIPCDQRYDLSDMKRISEAIRFLA